MRINRISGIFAVAPSLAFLLLGSIALAAGLGNTKEFKVEMKMTSEMGAPAGQEANVKFYVGDDRLRMEGSMGGMGEGGGSITVFEGDQVTMYMLVPAMKQYMKQVGTYDDYIDEGMGLVFGSPDDAQHPCQSDASMTCEKLGADTLLGRSVVKYRVTEIEDGMPTESTYWFDPELLFPLKMQNPEGSMEATSVEIGPQPDELFEIPAGYTEMQMYR